MTKCTMCLSHLYTFSMSDLRKKFCRIIFNVTTCIIEYEYYNFRCVHRKYTRAHDALQEINKIILRIL